MRISVLHFLFLLVAIAVSLSFVTPATFAGGTADAARSASAQPQPARKPDSAKKIWTNDDFPSAVPVFQEIPDRGAARSVNLSSQQPATAVPNPGPKRPSDLEKDPQWYAQQASTLESELAAVETKEQDLRNFRATGTGLPTGLNIYAPCEGVGTDNLIGQLEALRQDLQQQLNALEDTAQRNGLPPGILVEGRGRAQIEDQTTPEAKREELAQTLRERANELQATEATLAGMREQVAAAGGRLLPSTPADGGNLTTNLVEQLKSRANDLGNDIANAEDEARHAGIDPSQLP
jgi:hypothetical protein